MSSKEADAHLLFALIQVQEFLQNHDVERRRPLHVVSTVRHPETLVVADHIVRYVVRLLVWHIMRQTRVVPTMRHRLETLVIDQHSLRYVVRCNVWRIIRCTRVSPATCHHRHLTIVKYITRTLVWYNCVSPATCLHRPLTIVSPAALPIQFTLGMASLCDLDARITAFEPLVLCTSQAVCPGIAALSYVIRL